MGSSFSKKCTADDVIIAVVGQTGAGKSSFINTASGEEHLFVGRTLNPSPQEVQYVICPKHKYKGKRIVLVDVPALHMDPASTLHVQKKLRDCLARVRKENASLKISAILYLYNLDLPKLTDPPMRHLQSLKELFTESSSSFPEKVALVTTMWKDVGREKKEVRQEKLQEYWDKVPLRNPPRVMKYLNTGDSAWEIIFSVLGGTTIQPESPSIN